jgi:site-specific recombinase XerD
MTVTEPLRHLRAMNRSERTATSYLKSVRQVDAYLAGHGRTLLDTRRSDLEDFLADLPSRRSAATTTTRHKVLRIFHPHRAGRGQRSCWPAPTSP